MSEHASHSEADFSDFLREIWDARWGVLIGSALGVFAAFLFVFFAVPHYEARIVLAPANPMNMAAKDERSEGMSAQDLNFTRFEAGFKGADVAGLLLRDPEITDGLTTDKGFTFDAVGEFWTPSKLAEYIDQRVEVDPVGETPLRILSYAHADPRFAVKFINRLHNVTDGLIRHEMRRGVNERIAYLNASLATTNNPDHRRAMTDLLMEQERLKMLASIDQPYAASVVVKASASPKSVWPDLYLVYAGLAALGAFLGFVVMSVRRAIRDEEEVFKPSKVEQQEWFFPESGNNNEKPQKRPITGKKKKQSSKPAKRDVSDAAE